MTSIWVVCADYGTEGLQEPFIAFQTEDEAEKYRDLNQDFPANQMMKIVEAPLIAIRDGSFND